MSDTLQPNSKQCNLAKVSSPLPAPMEWSPFNNENVLQLADDHREILVQGTYHSPPSLVLELTLGNQSPRVMCR